MSCYSVLEFIVLNNIVLCVVAVFVCF